ncbi:putative dehydrogenase [Desulfomicrobium macestii]|uniref:Dehydrogenase n=1 Tax=Desulfomicrobium macestii TaxID=90731 RepID=A0ABR9H798_9BACT|nr:Gfo/Idh/MocA family oxidoreductase [Desulfomicrobium macestii]MBE1426392.1 putative dehydrogenase [Desulfomicrobium macestii]
MVQIALLGCGRISKRHCELLGSRSIKGAKLAAVCDVRSNRAEAAGKQWGVPWFTDLHKMMHSLGDNIDAVSILTESGNHARHTLELAPYRKHIIVEKPMALTLDDADAMIHACDVNGIKLFVIKQNRFNLPVVKLREALESGRFGRLVMGTVRVRWCRTQAYYDQDTWRGTWALDGGVLANQASHHLDLLEWIMGDVKSVFAKSRRALVNIEAEDTAVAILQFRNGALGIIEATNATRPKDLEGSLSVLGENGNVVIGGFAVNKIESWAFNTAHPDDSKVLEHFSVNPPDVYGFGHRSYYEHVINCLNEDSRMLVDGLEGRRSLELITAIYESIETGKEVFLRFAPNKCKLGLRN